MLYLIPTKNGLGVEIWGTYEDLKNLYNVVSKFWNHEEFIGDKFHQNRDKVISGFSYELRKGYDGYRLKKDHSHFYFESNKYFGFQISWVQMLFTLSTLRYNMRFFESNKYDLSIFLQLEYWLENSMTEYDEVGAQTLIDYISDGIYLGNNYIYQYMRVINYDYFLLGGGKKNFRKLPELLKRSVYSTDEYNSYLKFLEDCAKKEKCDISDLELKEDDSIYENVKW